MWSSQTGLVVVHAEACDTEIQLRGDKGRIEGSDLKPPVSAFTTFNHPIAVRLTRASTQSCEPELDVAMRRHGSHSGELAGEAGEQCWCTEYWWPFRLKPKASR